MSRVIKKALPKPEKLEGAVTRLVLEYPKAWDPLIDEKSIRELVKDSFEFHFLKQPQYEPRIRLDENQSVGSLTSKQLLNEYWRVSQTPEDEIKSLNQLAGEILHSDE